MTKNKKYLVAGISTMVAIVAIAIAAMTAPSHHENHGVASATRTTHLSDSNTTSTSSAVVNESSTTVKARTQVVDPKPYAPRTPVVCARPGQPSGQAFPGNDPNGAKQWVTVATISGACDGVSKSFHLGGIDTRLAWRSDAPSFAAFVLDQNGLDSTGGYADAECTGACSDYQSLVDGPGDFKLSVQSDGGPWQLMIQEYR